MPNECDHDLIIRIDERQRKMSESLENLHKKITNVVVNDDEYKQTKNRVDDLWDSRNKVIGWMMGAGIAGGGVVALVRGVAQVLGISRWF